MPPVARVRSRSILVVTLSSVALSGAWRAPQSPATRLDAEPVAPTLTVRPSSGQPGTSVTVTGAGYTAGARYPVELHWEGAAGPLLATAELDGNGGFRTTIRVPGAAAAGSYGIVACQVSPGVSGYCDQGTEFYVGAEALFTVLRPQLPPAPTPEPNQPLIPQNLDGFVSIVGEGPVGWFGAYGSAPAGFDPTLYIPRCTAPAEARVLDFDGDAVGSPPDVTGVAEVREIDSLVEVAPSGTISPRHALRTIDEEERVVAQFAEPQRYVGLHVGDEAETGERIELIGLDAAGRVVGVDRVSSAHRRVDVCMAISGDGAPAITQVMLRTPSPSPELRVDRMFFSSEGELPTAPRPVRGSIEFLRPTDRAELSTRVRQLVLGTVRVPLGLDIDEVALTVPRWNRTAVDTRLIDVSPLWVVGDEQLYSFVGGGIYLPEGASYVTVTATGPGVIASAFVEVTGIGPPLLHPEDVAGRVDIEPITMEVTQAVRGVVDMIDPGTEIDERSDAVLVQNKKTVVRAFARLRMPGGETFTARLPVNAELVGTRDGRTLPGSPLAPEHATTDLRVWTERSAAYQSMKQETHTSWNFVIPDSWTAVGEIDLGLEVNAPHLAGHIVEHPDHGGDRNRIGLNRVRFRSQPKPAVNVWLVDYYYRCGASGVTRPGQGVSPTRAASFCTGRSEGDLVNAKPSVWDAAEAILTWWDIAPFPGHFPDFFDYWDFVFAAAEDPSIPEESITGPILGAGSPTGAEWLGMAFRGDLILGTDGFGTMNVLMSSFVRGKAWGSPSFFRVTPNLTTTAHEAAHTMGLRHTGDGHGESWWVLRWGGDHGEIARRTEDVSAFSTLRMRAHRYETADTLHDYMSYGPRRWSSLDVWHHVEDAVGTNVARVDNRVDEHIAVVFGFAGPPAEEDEVVILRGTLGDAGLHLAPGFNLPGGLTATAGGDLSFRVLDAAGRTLHEAATLLLEANHDPGEPGAFSVPVYVPDRASEIVLLRDGEEIERRAVAPAPSGVVLSAPAEWPAEGPVEISWSQSGGGEAARWLLETSRDGEEWFVLAETEATAVILDAAALPFQGAGWRLRVQGSSGLAIGISPPVATRFPARAVRTQIVLPMEGQVFSSNTLIPLRAAVSRFSEGAEAALVWTVGGRRVATGPAGLTFAGDPGEHEVRLTDPATGAESVVTFTVIVDADLDGMADEWETRWGFDPLTPDGDLDSDGDGLAAWEEHDLGSSPRSVDTDGDGYSDLVEATVGTDAADATSIPAVWLDGGPVPRIGDGTPRVPLLPLGRRTLLLVVLLALVIAMAILALLLRRAGRPAG